MADPRILAVLDEFARESRAIWLRRWLSLTVVFEALTDRFLVRAEFRLHPIRQRSRVCCRRCPSMDRRSRGSDGIHCARLAPGERSLSRVSMRDSATSFSTGGTLHA